MAKKISDPKKRIKIELEFLQEAVELGGQGRIPKAKFLEALEKSREQRAALAQEAKELFERISRKVGSEEAKKIFDIASKRVRGSTYGAGLDAILLLHSEGTGSPTRTARRAIELGLQEGEEALIKHIQILRRKRRKRPAAERDK
jgi:hypothetical protein